MNEPRELTARERLARVHRRWMVRMARDLTDDTGSRRALVLAPHPDDETLGCGATIARKTASGTTVRVIVAADGGSSVRRAECIEACRALGVGHHDVAFLGYPDQGLMAHVDAVAASLAATIRELQPTEVYAPFAIDQHPDHRALAFAVASLRSSVLTGVDVLTYPIWLWNRAAWVDPGSAPRQLGQFAFRFSRHLVLDRPRIVRTGEFLAVKQAALAAHASQIEDRGDGTTSDALDPRWLELFLGSEELFFAA